LRSRRSLPVVPPHIPCVSASGLVKAYWRHSVCTTHLLQRSRAGFESYLLHPLSRKKISVGAPLQFACLYQSGRCWIASSIPISSIIFFMVIVCPFANLGVWLLVKLKSPASLHRIIEKILRLAQKKRRTTKSSTRNRLNERNVPSWLKLDVKEGSWVKAGRIFPTRNLGDLCWRILLLTGRGIGGGSNGI